MQQTRRSGRSRLIETIPWLRQADRIDRADLTRHIVVKNKR